MRTDHAARARRLREHGAAGPVRRGAAAPLPGGPGLGRRDGPRSPPRGGGGRGDGPTAPVRLVTVYSGEEQVRDLLDRRHDDFAQVLSQVAGRQGVGREGVRTPDRGQPSPTPRRRRAARRRAAASAAAGAGTAYLKRRQASLRSREDAVARRGRAGASASTHALTARRGREPAAPAPGPAAVRPRPTGWCSTAPTSSTEPRSAEFAAALDGLRGPGDRPASSPARGRPTRSPRWSSQRPTGGDR